MLRTARAKFDSYDLGRKLKRIVESILSSYRKMFIFMICICVFFYILPPTFRHLFFSVPNKKDRLVQCMNERLTPYFLQNLQFDANIRHVLPLQGEDNFIPYVGNGYIGMEIAHDSSLNIKSGRTMQLPIKFYPIVSVMQTDSVGKESTVVEYLTGMVHRFQCYKDYFVIYTYYAHRTQPNVLMQEIQLTNTRNSLTEVELINPRVRFPILSSRILQLEAPGQSNPYRFKEFEIITGKVQPKTEDSSKSIIVTIVKPQKLRKLQVRKHGTVLISYPIIIYYSKLVTAESQLSKTIEDIEYKATESMIKVLQKLTLNSDSVLSLNAYREEHIYVWSELWATGFTISTSKARNSLNGDKINATMYAVLSQVRSYEFEESGLKMPANIRNEISKDLTYSEGCYDSYHTLQAEDLWRNMENLEQLNGMVSLWLLTLEKQGCHNLLKAGASGVIQAMVLSFGSFRFSNQHLECNMHPKFLHRDFHFRRLNYGNRTHVNVTITVKDDNKAVIYVALDRSDRSYYACDAGCLDEPILLTQNRRQFPVKLTEPLTAILYITEDKQHIEELHQAIHLKEVAEAPAHEQHVIALHKHGHHLGGLPTLFWVSICAIIIVFHIFLCKLIVKEYCESSDKIRYRFIKP